MRALGGRGRSPGTGKATYPNGTAYEGAFVSARPEGTGTMTYPDGFVYQGSWKAGKREGEGFATWPDGTTYRGGFKADLREGQGRFGSARWLYLHGRLDGRPDFRHWPRRLSQWRQL